MYKVIIVVIITVLFGSCNTLKLENIGNVEKGIEGTKQPKQSQETRRSKTHQSIGFKYHSQAKKALPYAPIEANEQWNYTRGIRVNVHFLHDSTSNENIPEEEAVEYARYLLIGANNKLKDNQKMRLPVGNDTPVLPINYRYSLFPNNEEAVHIHHDNELFYFIPKGKGRNNYSRKVIDKYAIQADSVLNIFVLPLDPNGDIIKKNPNYTGGIAMGHSLKISGNFHTKKTRAWRFANILNHEIGHILGLSHSWIRSDGCDDTPSHNNCWNKTDEGKCNKVISNNIMDYNYSESSLTPCQIGKINQKIARLDSKQRSLIVKDWCQLDTSRTITISDSTTWEASLDLSNNVRVEEGAILHIRSRVSFAPGSHIYIAPGGTIILDKAYLHNDCNKTWKGIILASKGNNKAKIVYRNEVLIQNVAKD